METKNRSLERRGVLKSLGLALLGIAGWPILRKESGVAEAKVFAGLFLQNPPHVHIPPGYYDPKSQLYFDAETKEPMFVAQAKAGETKGLSEKELSEKLKGEGMISVDELKRLQKDFIKTRGQFTSCTLSSYITTSCCPIFTDTRSDRIDDD